MISKKYLNDYTLDIKTDENGKVANEYVYTADYYSFDLKDEETKSLRTHLLLYIVAITIAFLVPLFIYSTLSRVVYVVLPYVLLLIPIYLLIQAITFLYRNNGLLKREERDKSFDRLKGIPIFTFFLLLLTIIGQIVGYRNWSGQLVLGDYILSAGTFVILLFTFLFFQETRSIKIKTVKNHKADEIEKK